MSQPNAFGVFLTIFLCSRQVANLNRFSTSSADLITFSKPFTCELPDHELTKKIKSFISLKYHK